MLMTHTQTHTQTNRSKNITSLTEVIIFFFCRYVYCMYYNMYMIHIVICPCTWEITCTRDFMRMGCHFCPCAQELNTGFSYNGSMRTECLSSSNSHAHGILFEQDVTSLHVHGNLTHALPIMDLCIRNGPSSSNSHVHRISCAWVVT